MEPLDFIIKIAFAVALGAIIGSEREKILRQRFAGIRTFSLISLFGAILGIIAFFDFPFAYLFPIIGMIAITAYTYYIFRSVGLQLLGMATLVTIHLTYFVGLLAGIGYFQPAIATTFIILGVLLIGRSLHRYIEHLSDREIGEIVQFGLIIFVLFPIIPKEPLVINGIVIDLVLYLALVLLVSLISFLAFLANRLFKFGSTFSGFLGGIVNSTAMIYMLAKKSEKRKTYTSAVMAAIFGSILRNSLLTFVFLQELAVPLVVFFFAILAIAAIFIIFEKREYGIFPIEQPFSLSEGIKFATILFFGSIIFQVVSQNFQNLVVLASFLGSTVSTALVIFSLSISVPRVGIHVTEQSIIVAIAGSMVMNVVVSAFQRKKEFIIELSKRTIVLLAISAIFFFIVQ